LNLSKSVIPRGPRVANHRAGDKAVLQPLNAGCPEGEDYREPISLEWMKMQLDFKPGYESIIAYCLPFEFIVVGKDTNPKCASKANQKTGFLISPESMLERRGRNHCRQRRNLVF
jgi:hypothetical protein